MLWGGGWCYPYPRPCHAQVDCPDLGRFCTGAHATLTTPPLWSPESPAQHTATIELIGSSGAVLDR